MLVPSPAVRSMALGIMLAVTFVLAATLTLLPGRARQARAPDQRGALPWVQPASTARRGSSAGRSGCGGARGRRDRRRRAARRSPPRCSGCSTGMPSIKVVPETDSGRVGYDLVQDAFGAGAPGRCRSSPPRAGRPRRRGARPMTPASPRSSRRSPARRRHVLLQAVPTVDPSDAALGAPRPAARDASPQAPWSAARPRRTTTSSSCWTTRPRWSSASSWCWGSCCCWSRCRRR